MKFSFFPMLCVMFLGQFVLGAEPSWPIFHGPKGNNISPETGLLKTWPEEGPKLIWKAEGLGNTNEPGYSSVVVAEGRAFSTGNVKTGEENKPANSHVYAIDVNTGKILWQYDNGPGWTGHYPGDRSTPTIDGDRVYALSATGELVCLEAATGKKIWSRNVKDDADAKLPTWAYAESPVIDGDKVVCWPGGTKSAVMALDKMTGKTIWETPGSDMKAAYATMIIFEQGGKRIYANMNQKGVLGVDAKDGKQLFHYEHATSYDVNATMPYYFDGKLLLSSGYGTTGTELTKVNLDGDKGSLERIWQEKKLDNQHGGLIVLDGYAYGASHHYKGGAWICLNLADGKIAWEKKVGSQGSISFADGMLYLFTENEGYVILAKPTPEKYDEVSRFQIPEDGGGKCWAHPVICGKKLFIRRASFLYCYDIAEK